MAARRSRQEMEELGYRRWEPLALGGLRRPRPGQKKIHHGADQQGAQRGTQTRRRNLFRKEKREGCDNREKRDVERERERDGLAEGRNVDLTEGGTDLV